MSLNTLTLSPATMRAHKARWWVVVDGQKMPHTSAMRGRWDYEVSCSCGWESRTGGGVRRYVEEVLWEHRFQAQGGYPENSPT